MRIKQLGNHSLTSEEADYIYQEDMKVARVLTSAGIRTKAPLSDIREVLEVIGVLEPIKDHRGE